MWLFLMAECRKVRTPNAKYFVEFGANELRAKDFSLEQTMFVKRKSVDPLYASKQNKPRHSAI